MPVLFFRRVLISLSGFQQDCASSHPRSPTEFTGNNRTRITQMIKSICFPARCAAGWSKRHHSRSGKPTNSQKEIWQELQVEGSWHNFREPQTEREREREHSVTPSLIDTEKVNSLSQIKSYVKEPSTKDNQNDDFWTHIYVGLFMVFYF